MSELTKEWLQKTIAELEEERDATPGSVNEDAAMALAAMKRALASLEANPLGYIDAEYAGLLNSGHIESCSVYAEPGEGCCPVYTAQPAPEFYKIGDATMRHIFTPTGITDVSDMQAVFDQIETVLAGMWQPASVSDSLLSELLAIAKKAADAADECANSEWSDDSMEHSTAIADWELRAAMLQGAGNSLPLVESKPFSITSVFKPLRVSEDEIDCDNCAHYQPNVCHGEGCPAAMLQGTDGGLTNEDTITATQFKPVADLYGLTSPTGSETSFTFDAVEARDFIDGGWSCQEYVELEQYQDAMLKGKAEPVSNRDELPDGWVACSERMPEGMTDVHISNGHDVGQGWWDGDTWQTQHDYYSVPGDVTHWMSLPASPKK